MGKQIKPYGSWDSPVTVDSIVSAVVQLGGPIVDGSDLYWLEGRPSEGGRNVLVRQVAASSTSIPSSEDVTPEGFNVRNRVHEYGGAAALMHDGAVYFSNDSDQRLYRQALGVSGVSGRTPEPITPETVTPNAALRFADGVVDPARKRGIWVMEDHRGQSREAINSIVAVPLDGGEPVELTGGNDFYAAPRLSPDGSQLAWLAWNHPNMPWDGCELWLAGIARDGTLEDPRPVAGGISEAIFQPAWSPDGVLYFVSDQTGWWNIYRLGATGQDSPGAPEIVPEIVIEMDAEFGLPYWSFGMSTYAFESKDRLFCTYSAGEGWQLASVDLPDGSLRAVETEFTEFGTLHISDGVITTVAGSNTRPAALVRIDAETGETLETVAVSTPVQLDAGLISSPEAIEFPTSGNKTAHAYYYAPTNSDFAAPEEELPPLIVMSHGGPTGSTSAGFDMRTQFWTSRGFAVVDVNYGGSTGYGRKYRERLNDRWGIVDVDDCCNAALYLVERGLADGNRLAIRGGSAGGYTTLAALAFRDVFKAGVSLYGIGDLEAMAKDTHKFESRYLDGLIGPYPERRDIYLERSPIHHTDGLSCPIAFFQGLEDKIVPPNQAQMMVDVLRNKGLPVAHVEFEGEQHGFRRAENIKTAIDGELYFYSKIFGFEPAGDVQPI
ncbi:MAG: S9 family peptidase, partial [Chloroflexi bacterium]|nr:S9 family peptidase [Chloroflexota bacterium]